MSKRQPLVRGYRLSNQPKEKVMAFALTQKGIRAVAQVKSKYEHLKPEYKTNTFDRVVFEMGNMPACVICYAIAKPSSADFSDMVRQGYATR